LGGGGLVNIGPPQLNFKTIYIIKEFVQPKMSLNREFLIWKEKGIGVREREREREVGWWISRQDI
jgi:hypothetical protein